MINFYGIIKEDIEKRNPKQPEISDRPYRKLITRGLGYETTNLLFNLISQRPYIHKICFQDTDSCEAKYQFLISKQENIGLKHLNYFKAFIE